MLKHKTHHGESLNLNWQSSVPIHTRVVVGKGTMSRLPDLLAQIEAGEKVLLLKQPNLFMQEIDHLRQNCVLKTYQYMCLKFRMAKLENLLII